MRVYEGEAVRFAGTDGDDVMLSDGVNPVHRMAVANGEAVFAKLPEGRYWGASRAADGTMTDLGTVDVVPLHDPVEVKLRREVAALDERIRDLEGTITFQESNTNSGAFKAKAQLGAIRKARANAEARLGDYLACGRPTA